MKYTKNKIKKNILIYCPIIERGGIQTTLIKYANFLSNKYEVKIFTEKCDKRVLRNFKKEIKIFETINAGNSKSRILKDINVYLLLKKKAQKKDIILSIHDHVVPLILNKIFNKNKIIIRTAGIVPNNNNFNEQRYLDNLLLKKIFLRIYRLADKVITFSEENVKYFYSIGVKACCIYNNFEKQKTLSVIKNKKILDIFFIGRFSYEKNADFFLKNMMNFSKVRIHLVGDGYQKEKLKIIAKRKPNIIFHGYVKNPFKKFLNKIDLLCVTSKFDGTPNVMGEAMSYGIPVLAPENVGLSNLFIKNEKNGFLYKSEDKNSFKKKINQIINNFSLRKNKAKNGYLNIRRYNFKNTHQKLIDEIDNL